MKNRIYKLISSLLILAFIVSCMSVFAYADTSAAEDDSASGDAVTLLVNRTYDEGWGFQNGFKSAIGGNKFGIEYEETENFDYNYFCRVESVDGSKGYMLLEYGTNAVQYGNTALELDIKTDDKCNFGSPVILLKDDADKEYALVGITNNELLLTKDSVVATDTKPSYNIGSIADKWLHVAFVATVNQRRCPECGTIHTITESTNMSDPICCLQTQIEIDENGKEVETVVDGVSVGDMTTNKMFTIRIYFSTTETFDALLAKPLPKKIEDMDINNTYYFDISFETASNFKSFSIGMPQNSGTRGQSYLVDNVKLYNGSSMPGVEVEGCGLKVDESAAKTEVIISANSDKTVMEYINSGLVMKVGSDYCLKKGKKEPIFTEGNLVYGAPVKIDGEVYVPLEAILDWVDYPIFRHDDGVSFDISTENGSAFITIGQKTASANGVSIDLKAAPRLLKDAETNVDFVVVSKDDVETLFPGYSLTYDEMGLIAISDGDNLFNRESDLELMLDIMKSFLFNNKSASEIIESTKVNTNNFAHPYLFATQDEFNSLNAAYKLQVGQEGYDATLSKYLYSVAADAEAVYVKYANSADVIASTGVYLAAELSNPHAPKATTKHSNNGYNYYAGNNEELVTYAEEIRLLALAYQVTGEIKYARIAYEMAVDLSEWSHWAPAFFVNCADATAAYATAYDWLYNVWTECGFDLAVIENAIYQKGIFMGHLFTTGGELNDQYNSNQGVFAVYTEREDHWNVVGTSGMVIASLAILGSDTVASIEGEEEKLAMTHIKAILNDNIDGLCQNGLDAYAPDGSFAQSPDYWSYSTGALMRLIWVLESSVGDDFGLKSLWGLENTFYYAYQMEYKTIADENNSLGLEYWNYHESASSVLDTDTFFYAAEILGDDVIGALRVGQLDSKSATVWDVLSYNAKYLNVDTASANISRDYFIESCEGFVSRSDFSSNATFIGMMGGANDVTTGQIDSGNFIYANGGYTWFKDLGSDTTDLFRYLYDDHRYNYYRVTGEGNNVVLITTASLAGKYPYGQALNGGGKTTEYYTNDYGMYSIIDNSEVYGGEVISAHRGMLFTNNRSTVVVQDDIRFASAQACTWVAHTAAEIMISEDGRTAYLSRVTADGTQYLRVTLLEPGDAEGLHFEKMSTNEPVLSTTYKDNHSTALGYAAENDRTNLQRLVIKQGEQTSFQCAIVIELVDEYNSDLPVEYEYKSIDLWDESMVAESFVHTEFDDNVLTTPIITDIFTFIKEARGYIENDRAFDSRYREFYRAMVKVASIIRTYEPTGQFGIIEDPEDPNLDGNDYVEEYELYLEKFDLFRAELNSYTTEIQSFSSYITGFH